MFADEYCPSLSLVSQRIKHQTGKSEYVFAAATGSEGCATAAAAVGDGQWKSSTKHDVVLQSCATINVAYSFVSRPLYVVAGLLYISPSLHPSIHPSIHLSHSTPLCPTPNLIQSSLFILAGHKWRILWQANNSNITEMERRRYEL